jgi:glycosyltransferase involved in cell wall biosynthesis
LADLPDVHCTLVGDGAYHRRLVELSERLGLVDRCHFVRSMANRELTGSLREYDAVVSVNDYGGVSKVELEAAQAGMPIVTNAHPHEGHPEVLGRNCVVVRGGPDAWRQAIADLLSDEKERERLGRGVRHAVRDLRGDLMEQRYAALYEEVLTGAR